jgi:hypothetical protein
MLTGAGTVAGMAALVNSFGQFGQGLKNAAARAGMTADQLEAMEHGAQIAGAGAGSLTRGITTLRDNLVDAVGGRAPEFIRMMQSLGLSWHGAAGAALDVNRELPAIFDRIAALRDPTLQARAATALFGGSAEELLPFLRKGAAGLADYTAQARRYGVLNAAGVRAADELRQAQTRLGFAFEGLGYSVAQQAAPSLVKLMDTLGNFVVRDGPAVSRTVGILAADLNAWASGGGLEKIAKGMKLIGDDAAFVADKLGFANLSTETWTRGLELLGTTMVLRVTGLSALAAALGRLSLVKLPSFLLRLLGAGPTTALTLPLLLKGDTPDTPYDPTTDPYSPKYKGPAGGPNLLDRAWHWFTGSTSGGGAPIGSAATAANRQESWNFWRSKGFSVPGAAAMLAAEGSESGFNPGDIGDGGAARGSFQWHADRRAAIFRATGIDVANPATTHAQQLQAMYEEMRQGLDPQTGAAFPAIRDATGTYGAAFAEVNGVERPGDRAGRLIQDQRAADFYAAKYGAGPVYGPPAPAPVAAAPTAGPSGKANLTVRLAGFPESTMTAATTSGDLWDNTPIIERAMPMTAGR